MEGRKRESYSCPKKQICCDAAKAFRKVCFVQEPHLRTPKTYLNEESGLAKRLYQEMKYQKTYLNEKIRVALDSAIR